MLPRLTLAACTMLRDRCRAHSLRWQHLWTDGTAHLQVHVKGNTVWKNPRGYLPGARQPLMPFHASISLLYLILAGTWLALHLLNQGHISAPQHLVTVCVAFGMLEASLDYADVYSINGSGFISPALSGVTMVVACAFKACVRVTVLLIARGFGTFRPASYDCKVALFGALPACCALLQTATHRRGQHTMQYVGIESCEVAAISL
jgi:Lung seven transmembrane receptor